MTSFAKKCWSEECEYFMSPLKCNARLRVLTVESHLSTETEASLSWDKLVNMLSYLQ